MDDLQRKQQLLLRQQKHRPTLKYSNTAGAAPYNGSSGLTDAYPSYPVKHTSSTAAPSNTRGMTNGYVPEASSLYQGSYSAVNAPTHGSVVPSHAYNQYQTAYRSSLVAQPEYQKYFLQTGGTPPPGVGGLTPAQILASSIQTSAKVTTRNPYARPVSAQDVTPLDKRASPLGTVGISMRSNSQTNVFTASSSSMGSNASNGNQANFTQTQSSTSLQTNSFMRPKSALNRDNNTAQGSHSSSIPSEAHNQGSSQTSGSHSGSEVTHATPPAQKDSRVTKRIPVANSPDFLMTQPVQPLPPSAIKPGTSRPNSANRIKPTASNHGNNSMTNPQQSNTSGATSTPTQNGRSTTTNKTNHSEIKQAISKPIPQTQVLFKPPVGPKRTIPGVPSALSNRFTDRFSQPGSGSRSSSRQSPQGVSSRSPTPVRNPNYTPTKPYIEVSDPSLAPVSGSGSSTVSPATTATNKLHQKVDINTNKSKSAPSNSTRTLQGAVTQDNPVKKMPVTNTMTGTVFYRKASKTTEEVLNAVKNRLIAEQKLATQNGTKSGASSQDEDEEWTDEEEEQKVRGKTKNPSERPAHRKTDTATSEDDSEADGMDDDADDDEAIDNLDDDLCGSDDDSDTMSIPTSGPSRQGSGTVLRVRSATRRLQTLAIQERHDSPTRSRPATARIRRSSSATSIDPEPQPALMPSLFPNVPPTVNFVVDGQKVDPLPWEFRKLLKWRMSPITPNVVKNCIARSGFRYTNKSHDWLGYWGKHMKAPGFKAIRDYQKVNHFPGSFQIGRKDRLWRNLSKMQVHFGKKEYGFFPQTFVMPFDTNQLKRAWEEGGNKQKWIIKPPASARGIGIKVISKWAQIPKRRSVIVQRYLGRPYLINESKFDLRIYVYVTSYDPLRIYVYEDGLARFASCKYSYSMKTINNKYMHLTNYSINKFNQGYEANSDENICQGHKWGLKALWGYMKKQGVNTSAVWESIKDLVIRTIISSESCVNSMVKANVKRKYSCHELFGFDVMLDENLKPWIIEVNISPSLHSNSQLDMNIKGGMIKDLFNLAGFTLPDKADLTPTGAFVDRSKAPVPPNPIVIDKRLFPPQVAPDERTKHAYYCQRHQDEFVQQTITETLTPDDVRLLVESVDEDSRRGNFQRVFPSVHTHKYLRFLEQPRYYNLLLNQWVQRYHRMEARGVALLESLCNRGVHLEAVTDDPKHQWSPSSSSLPPREPRPVGSAPAHKAGLLPTMKKKKSGESGVGSALTTPRPPTSRSAGSMATS